MKRKTNVLFIDYANEVGGSEVFLMETLKHLGKGKFNLFVLTGGNGKFKKMLKKECPSIAAAALPYEKTGVKRSPERKNSLLAIAKSFFQQKKISKLTQNFIRKNDIDIVVSNTVKSACFGINAAKKTDAKSVWIIHDFLSKDFYKGWMLKAIKTMVRKPDVAVCVSKKVKQTYLDFSRSSKAKKTVVVYNGIDLKKFNPKISGTGIRRELSIKGPVASIVGRLEPLKGQKQFIGAAAIALQKKLGLTFLIVGAAFFGEHAFERECKELVKKRGLQKKVLFLGFREDIPRIIAASDIIVHASIKPEPFGRDIIEAMACGKPVVSTNIGGPTEIICRNSGILVEPNNPEAIAKKILQLLGNPKQAASMGKKARQRAKGFDVKKTAKKIGRLLEALE